jgi:hypothetical protein
MRFGNLLVNCGPYRILIPGENIAAINEDSGQELASISIRQARDLGWPLVINTRILLGLDPAGSATSRVNIQWHSCDGSRRTVLRVDGVDGLRHGGDTDVLKLPRVPNDMRGLFDGLVCDGNAGFLLQLRRDVSPPMDTTERRTRFARSVLGALPQPRNASNRMEP